MERSKIIPVKSTRIETSVMPRSTALTVLLAVCLTIQCAAFGWTLSHIFRGW